MEQYVALDVSLEEISVCVIDGKGAVTFEGKVAAEPAALIRLIRSKAPQLARVGLETGATSPWLYHALEAAGLPVVLMDARHANAALSTRPTQVGPQRRPRPGRDAPHGVVSRRHRQELRLA
jgi:transposase